MTVDLIEKKAELQERQAEAHKLEQGFQDRAHELSPYDRRWHDIEKQLDAAADLGNNTAIINLVFEDMGPDIARNIQRLEQRVISSHPQINDVLVGDTRQLALDLKKAGLSVHFEINNAPTQAAFTRIQMVVSF